MSSHWMLEITDTESSIVHDDIQSGQTDRQMNQCIISSWSTLFVRRITTSRHCLFLYRYIKCAQKHNESCSIMNNRLRAYNRSKSRVNNKILCSACYCYRSSELFSTNYCCTSLTNHHTRQICDTCVHEYIVSVLNSCLVSSIVCPEFNCRAYFTQSVICRILFKYGNKDLLNDYLHEQQWQGKSNEWIKRFTLPCPGCHVPIEKDGGCNQMICSRCQLHFYWTQAKRYGQSNKETDDKCYLNSNPVVDYIIFVFILVMCIVYILTYINVI